MIAITTRDPGTAPRLDASIGYGNYDTRTGQIYASAGLNEQIAGNIAAFFSDQKKGWGRNIITGHDTFRQYTYGLHSYGAMTVYTSSGAGTWGPPMRVGSRPEIVLIRFE